ncbi:MAG: sugar phosphate isomerase/epimerase [Phycisphaerae bacterium]|nr:sugar phosphate isomerase/epimerase [Phycisphaerae bacterium]
MTWQRVAPAVLGGLLLLGAAAGDPRSVPPEQPSAEAGIFSKSKLVAWCIVPFDKLSRGPRERAEMLVRLGLTRCAYDWRKQHVPTFEQEILEYKKHGIEFFAFWNWHPSMEALVRKHGIRPQIWRTLPSSRAGTQAERVKAAAQAMLPLVETASRLGLKLGLYNHGGWGGEPNNLVAVCRHLREQHGADHVGIVYNFHHGHGHISDFEATFRLLKPYLLCVNLNGMNDGAKPKILGIGRGKHERTMIDAIRRSGYAGPVGILGHQAHRDVEKCLAENIEGLDKVVRELSQRNPD